ncbi:MAG: penicillin-binding protein 1C, partial [Candidatus Cloacimonadota bacterium]|nr:penicillin-binding protein 1C [Candidatus Cloacimonadota bacterium]
LYKTKRGILFSIIICIILFFIFLPLPLENFSPESQVIKDCNDEIIRVYLDENQQWHIKAKREIPEKVEQAFLTFEDRSFYYHPGFDPLAIIRAFYLNWKNKEIVSGGSTITMQTIRLLQPKKRTYLNKFYELLQALKLEIIYSKKEILQMYLNNTPYGGNIVGYETACQKYFRKSPQQLSWGEVATLAILPNQPSLIMPGKNQKLLFEKRNKLLQQLYHENAIDSLTYKAGIREPISNEVFRLPQKAIHFTNRVKDKYPNQNKIVSSLDISLQNLCEEIMNDHITVLENYGIGNSAIILIDNETGEIKAYVGSQDYFIDQVDGVISPRSSGSILKPFLYAQAIDEGLLLPQTKIKDIPTFYDSFSPENSDGKFHGLVTMQEALVQSRNIPAIRVLNKYGLQDFYNFLNFAGVSSLSRDAEKYGLTLIIGGAETSLFDVAHLYYGLANYGNFRKLSFLHNQTSQKDKQYISAGASYLICDVLKDLNRPGLHYYWNEFAGNPNLAWKTGTSNGHKDAWAVGINPKW